MNYFRYVVSVFLASFISLAAAEMQGYLTQDDIALFYKQGYLIKRQCLSQEEMAQLNEDVTCAIDRSLEGVRQFGSNTFSNEEQIAYVDGSRVVFKQREDKSISIARINGSSGVGPALIETVRSEKIAHTFFELLGTSDLEHLISQIHPKLPGDGIAFLRHHDIQYRKSFDPDWQDVLGNGSYAICIIPIDSMSAENGGLWIDKNNYPEFQGLEEDLVWLYTEPGDLLFMHPYLYHGSGPNFSPVSSRKMLLTGFCAFGANHKAYPGAHVNAHLTLREDGSIHTEASPWSQSSCVAPISGH